MVIIDRAYYPHILESVVDCADPAALKLLRATCSEVRHAIDTRLWAHAVYTSDRAVYSQCGINLSKMVPPENACKVLDSYASSGPSHFTPQVERVMLDHIQDLDLPPLAYIRALSYSLRAAAVAVIAPPTIRDDSLYFVVARTCQVLLLNLCHSEACFRGIDLLAKDPKPIELEVIVRLTHWEPTCEGCLYGVLSSLACVVNQNRRSVLKVVDAESWPREALGPLREYVLAHRTDVASYAEAERLSTADTLAKLFPLLGPVDERTGGRAEMDRSQLQFTTTLDLRQRFGGVMFDRMTAPESALFRRRAVVG